MARAMRMILVAFLVTLVSCNEPVPEELSAQVIHELITTKQQTCLSITEYYVSRIANFDKRARIGIKQHAEKRFGAGSQHGTSGADVDWQALMRGGDDIIGGSLGDGRPYPCCTDGPVPNSVIALQPLWATYAQALDQRFNETGELVGPLHCVPVMVKDNINTKDMPTSAGAVALRYQIGAPDAESVRNMRESGAMILAKVNLAEFAKSGANTFSSLGRETVNPYDFNATVYGSSGGTGAAIGADFGVMGLGTDTCGSIVAPAGAANLFGLRPTWGKVSLHGVVPLIVEQDTLGPITRTVSDNALAFDALLFGADASKYTYSANIAKSSVQHVRVGVFIAVMQDSPFRHVATDPEEIELITTAADALRNAGAAIVEVDSVGNVYDALQGLFAIPPKCSPSTANEAFTEYFNLFSPEAPVRSLDDLITLPGMLPSSYSFLMGTLNAPPVSSVLEVCENGLEAKENIHRAIVELMEEYEVDVLLYPVQTIRPSKAARLLLPGRDDAFDSFCVFSAMSGMPSMSMPVGFLPAHDNSSELLPIGMIALARRDQEQLLYSVAFALEQETHPRVPTPLIPHRPIQ